MPISEARKIETPASKREKIEPSTKEQLKNVPLSLKINSVMWDDEYLQEEPLDFNSWIDALFGIRSPITIAYFTPVPERQVFTSTLIKGVNWRSCEEILVSLEESSMDPADIETLLTLIELVRLAALRDDDLKHIRLSRKPRE